MDIIGKYLIFVLLGIYPAIIADWNVADYQWWGFCIPLWIAIFWRDYVFERIRDEN